MKKLSRKTKLVISLLILLVCSLITTLFSNWPSPTAQIAFRRMEKRALIGPAKIIGTEQIPYIYYDQVMIGQSEYGYTIFSWNTVKGWDEGNMAYYPKQGDVTFFCPNARENANWYMDGWQLPFFVFSDHANAATARLTLRHQYDDKEEFYTLEEAKEEGGYFLFALNESHMSNTSFFELIRSMCVNYPTDSSIIATVTLYDRQGNVLDTLQQELVP